MGININTTAASAFSDLLSLALQLGSQQVASSTERKWRSEEAEKERSSRDIATEKERRFRLAGAVKHKNSSGDLKKQKRIDNLESLVCIFRIC